MTLLVPDVGEVKMLSIALKTANQLLKLYTNNKTPLDADVAADFTEMSTQGYGAKTLTAASWSVATVSSVAQGTYADQTWTFDGTGGDTTVYGYFVVDSATGTLLWSERFASSKLIRFAGDQIIITPTFTFSKA